MNKITFHQLNQRFSVSISVRRELPILESANGNGARQQTAQARHQAMTLTTYHILTQYLSEAATKQKDIFNDLQYGQIVVKSHLDRSHVP